MQYTSADGRTLDDELLDLHFVPKKLSPRHALTVTTRLEQIVGNTERNNRCDVGLKDAYARAQAEQVEVFERKRDSAEEQAQPLIGA